MSATITASSIERRLSDLRREAERSEDKLKGLAEQRLRAQCEAALARWRSDRARREALTGLAARSDKEAAHLKVAHDVALIERYLISLKAQASYTTAESSYQRVLDLKAAYPGLFPGD